MADLKTATNVQDQASPTLPAPAESLRVIVDGIPGIVSTLNAAGEVEFVNRPSLEYTGKTSEESKNCATSDLVHPDDLPRMMDAWRRVIETGQPLDHEIRNRRADAFLPHTIQMGSYFGIRASDGRLVAMAGERLQSTAFTEISAVCTHPEFRGRGYARGLTTFLAAQILAVGKTLFFTSSLRMAQKWFIKNLDSVYVPQYA